MHALDIIIAVIAAILIFAGLKRGLIGEVVRLCAMIAGFFTAFLYYQQLATKPPISLIGVQIQIRYVVAFILIYCLTVLLIIGAGWCIRKVIRLTPFGLIDRIAGACIGALKALFIAYVVCLSISSLPVRRIRNDFDNSVVYRCFSRLPRSFSLKSLLSKRAAMLRRSSSGVGEEAMRKISTFKTSVDSAKRAHESHK